MAQPFRAGDRVLLVDCKQRRHLVTLAEGGEFHTPRGLVPHDELIGRGRRLHRPHRPGAPASPPSAHARRVVLKMPRGAQVIYPKDLGPILVIADVFPERGS